MCDEADLAQDAAQQMLDAALKSHRATHTPAGPGRTTCVECGDPVPLARQRLGACRCIDCQQEYEFMERHGVAA